jgi:hypothetical protein
MYHIEEHIPETRSWTRDELQSLCTLEALRYEPDIMQVISAVMRQHGGSVESVDSSYILLQFPDGTRRYGLYPRLYSAQYEILFPDGFTIYQTTSRDGMNIVQFPLDVFPEALLLKYQQR